MIAIAAMVCDHIAWGFVEMYSVQGQIMHIIGRLTIPIMCFFIAEGYRKTSDIKKYISRMALFALISIVPFYLFFGDEYGYRQNIIFDHLLALLVLTVSDSKKLKKPFKALLIAALCFISAVIGGWPMLPIFLVLIFYYGKSFKQKAILTAGAVLLVETVIVTMILTNGTLHLVDKMGLGWTKWYEWMYFLGFILPLPLLYLYNGEKGKNLFGKHFFYLFYPCHFVLLYGAKLYAAGDAFGIYLGTHVFALACCVGITFQVVLARPSRSQLSAVTLCLVMLTYLTGFVLEIMTDSLDFAYAGVILEYVGEGVIFISFMWFMSELCRKKLPSLLYSIAGAVAVLIVGLVVTSPQNGIFYTAIEMEKDAKPFHRMHFEYGIGFYLFIAFAVSICTGTFIAGIRAAVKSVGTEKKRIIMVLLGIICPWLNYGSRLLNFTQGYEIQAPGVLGAVIFIYIAVVYYGYFDSIQLAGENALHRFRDGVLVVDHIKRVLYVNESMRRLFPQLEVNSDCSEAPEAADMIDGKITSFEKDDRFYDASVMELKEHGFVQGYMLQTMDVTEQHRHIRQYSEALRQIELQNEKLKLSEKAAYDANEAKSSFLANMSHEIRTPMNAIVGMCELILREDSISDTVRDYCYNIQNSGKSLLSIINDILDLSKIESGKMELVEDSFSLSDTLSDVMNMAVARKGEKPLEIIVNADPAIPSGLIGDELRIRQVIINFVTNAIKYSNEGCVGINIKHKRTEDGIILSVSVSDTGIGITEEDLKKLFSSFQQVDTKKNRSVEGTGLGLAISKKLITQMGGNIDVSSVYGKGSVFSFEIPLKVSDENPFIAVRDAEKIHAARYIDISKFTVPDAAELYRSSAEELGGSLGVKTDMFYSLDELKKAAETEKYTHIITETEEFLSDRNFFEDISHKCQLVLIESRTDVIDLPPSVKRVFKPFYSLPAAAVFNNESIAAGMNERRNSRIRFTAPDARILVVDDNAVNLKVAAGLMRPYNMQIFTAESAKAAFEILENRNIDLVFMDHMMPETDGVEATKMIREKGGGYFTKLPVIALTANALSGVKEMFLSAGFNDFLAKPIELAALDRVLSTWLPEKMIKAASGAPSAGGRRSSENAADSPDKLFSPETGINNIGGDKEGYCEILEIFVKSADEKLRLIGELLEKKDYKNYVIEVHALKSSAMTVGSKKLSEAAKELELAGKAENYSLIEEKNSALLEMYSQVNAEGLAYLESSGFLSVKEPTPEETADLEEISEERLGEFIERILSACSAFDDMEVIGICSEASEYSVKGIPLKELFSEVKSLAEDFECDKAAEAAKVIPDKLRTI